MTTAKQREKLKALGWEMYSRTPDYERWAKGYTDIRVYAGGAEAKGDLDTIAEFAAVLKEEAE